MKTPARHPRPEPSRRAQAPDGGRRTPGTERAEALRRVRAVYRALDARPVARDCLHRTECCRFRLTGRQPYLTRGEALVAAQAWRASGRTTLPADARGDAADGACPMLDPGGSGRCLVYQDRPFGCRTHFCRAAGGPYRREEVLDLIRELEQIDAGLGGGNDRAEGPHPLAAAVRRELAAW